MRKRSCQRTIIWNEINRYGECATIENNNDKNGCNQERANKEEAEEIENEVRTVKNSRRQTCIEIKVIGGANKNKYKGIKRLF